MKELRDYARVLDEDEGIRIFGRAEGFVNGGFIFLGVYMGRYCVNICDRVWDRGRRAYTVGRKNKYFYFNDFEETWKFLESIIRRPLKAWLF